MQTRKSKTFPLILTVLILIIIIYLFSNAKQPYVECDRKTTTDANILIKEKVKTNLDSNKITKLEIIKTIILTDDFKNNKEKSLSSIEYSLKKAYKYLGKNVKIKKEEDRVIVTISLDKKGTVILNDIDFKNNDNLQIEVENNTKSSNVITLSIEDKYTEGELQTRLKNNGYRCK